VLARLIASVALTGCSLIDAAGGGDGGACDPAFADDFEDGSIGSEWLAWSDEGATAAELDGALQVAFDGAGEAWAGSTWYRFADLRGGSVVVEVPRPGGAFTVLELRTPDEMKLQMRVDFEATLVAAIIDSPTSDAAVETAYLPAEHRRWRVREEDGIIFWQASGGGESWVQLHAQAVPFPLDRVFVQLSAGGTGGDPTAHFESIQLCAVAGDPL
jgi:hypothetical protein